MKSLFKIVFFLLCVHVVNAQTPAGVPTINSTGWAKYRWLQADSGQILPVRDTNWLPRFPTAVLWQNAGVDTAIWVFPGQRPWIRILKGGDELYAFSTGLTDINKVVTANLSTGVLGGQSVIGGTQSADTLRLRSNLLSSGRIALGTSNYNELNNNMTIGTGINVPYRLTVMPDTSTGIGNGIAVRRGRSGQSARISFLNQNNTARVQIDYDANDNLSFLMDGNANPYFRIYRQGEVAVRTSVSIDDSTRKLTVVDNKLGQDIDRVTGYFLNQVQYRTISRPHTSYAGAFYAISTKDNPANRLVNIGLYASANRADSNYAAIFDSGYIKMNTLPVGLSTDSTVVVDANGILKKGAPPSEGGGGVNNTNIGSGFRLLNDPSAQTLRTLFSDIAGAWDSVSNANGLTYKVDTSVIATLRALKDSVLLLLNNMPLISRIEFISGSTVTTYQNDTLIGKNILSLEIQGYSTGFTVRSNSVYISSFDSNTGTITLANGVFDTGDFVRILFRANPIYLLDSNGWPMKDSNGNYIILN